MQPARQYVGLWKVMGDHWQTSGPMLFKTSDDLLRDINDYPMEENKYSLGRCSLQKGTLVYIMDAKLPSHSEVEIYDKEVILLKVLTPTQSGWIQSTPYGFGHTFGYKPIG